MANTLFNGDNKTYVTVDTAPGVNGYFTDEVNMRLLRKTQKIDRIYFSAREVTMDSSPSVVTLALQFKCAGDADWQNYVPLDGSELAIGNRLAIEDFGDGVLWRAGIDYDGYTSGSVKVGFDW